MVIIFSSCYNNYNTTTTLEIIDLEKSLKQSNQLITEINEGFLQTIESTSKTELQYQPLLKKTKEFLAASKDLDRLIHQLKETLFKGTGGYYPNKEVVKDQEIFLENTLLKAQNIAIVEELFLSNNFQGNSQTPKANVLDTAIQTLENRWIKLLESCWENGGIPSTIFIKQAKKDALLKQLKKHLVLHSSKNYTLKTPKTWAEFNFKNQNFAAATLTLTSIQNEVRLFENAILQFLVEQTSYGDLVFDKFTLFSQSPNNKIRLGETYKVEISLGTYASKAMMEIIVDGDTLHTVDGIAQYSTRAKQLGGQKYSPQFILTNPLTGKKQSFRKEFYFDVIP